MRIVLFLVFIIICLFLLLMDLLFLAVGIISHMKFYGILSEYDPDKEDTVK